MTNVNVVALADLPDSVNFRFPKGNKEYMILALDGDTVSYANPDKPDSVYTCPASHDVVALKEGVAFRKVSKKGKLSAKQARPAFKKVITAKQREASIKGTTHVSDFKVLEARVASLESGQSQIQASLKTQSEALAAILLAVTAK